MQSGIGVTPPDASATPPFRQTPIRQTPSRPGASRPNATRIVTIRTTAPAASNAPAAATPPRPRPPTGHPAAPPSTRRRDIQGLRALAVLAVIFDHVIHWPTGGFVGVDIFFVISGFLITGILLREHERTGRISLRSFYASRLRRLLPSAAVVLVATAAIGSVLFNQTRALSTLWDAAASFLFVANWRFAALGTDYFSALAPASAVQHYWSLSVEEQFYLVWPWLMVLMLFAMARGSRTSGLGRHAVGILAAGVVAASFAYAVWDSATNPTVTYFSTLARAWELGIGALLAVAAPLAARMPVAWRVALGWAGLAGIVASFVGVTGDLAFPGPGAALPVLATALVLAAGVGGPQRTLFPLTNPVSVYLGNISYSLYLWHFPVFVFLTMLLPEQSTQTTLIILGTILAVSGTSYYLVEQPFHRSPWLRRRRPVGEHRDAWRSWREAFGTQFILSSMGVFVIVIVVAVSFQLNGGPANTEAPPAANAPSDVNPAVAIQAELAAAVAATAWPDDLSPSLDDAMARTSNDNPARDCFDIGDTPDFDRCTWGADNAPNHMYLVGDSEALSYAPAFKAIAEASNDQWRITTIGLYGCRFTEVLVANDGAGVMDACPQRKLDISDRIVADAPQLVAVANAFAEGQDADRAPLSVASLVASTLAETAGYNAAGKIVYLAAPPLGADLGQCYSAVSSPQDCNVGVGSVWQQFAAALSAPSATGDHFVSSLPFSCSEGICPAFAGTLPTRYDTVHLTPAYAEHVAPAIRDALGALGLM